MGRCEKFSTARFSTWTYLIQYFHKRSTGQNQHECRLYADDNKLIGVIEKEEDAIDIQKDIDSMESWAKTWQMTFNYDKWKVMHFGKKNREQTYKMKLGHGEQQHVIEKSLVERDLGLLVSSDLKWATQVAS